MAFDTELRDEQGQTVASFWTGPERSYVLPDGSRCTVPQTAAWCRDCESFVAAEEVPPLEYIDQRLAALRAGPHAFAAWARASGEPVPEHVVSGGWPRYQAWAQNHWERVRAWRALRQSPPRCLQCFTTNIDPVQRGATFAMHPETKQRLTVHVANRTTTTDRWEYSPEGLPFEAPESE